MDVYMPCLETVELEQALARRDHREEIVKLSYWCPVLMSDLLKERREEEERQKQEAENEKRHNGTSIFNNYRSDKPKELSGMEKTPEPVQPIPSDRPRFMVAYATGVMQLMRNLFDQDPVIVRLPNIKLTDAKWSPNGAFIAVCGTLMDRTDKNSCIYFISAYGQIFGYHQITHSRCLSVSWHASGFLMTVSTNELMLLGQIRPEYKWGCIEDTLIYVYQNEEMYTYSVMFYDYKTLEKKTKSVKYFENLASYKEHCLVVYREDEVGRVSYHCDLCNSIGIAMDYVVMNVHPKFVQVNGVAAVIASEDRYFIWHFNLPKPDTFLGENSEPPGENREYLLEEQQRPIEYGTKRILSNKDQIVSLCIGDTFFLVALRNGGVYHVNLYTGVIMYKYAITATVDTMKLNCDFTKLAFTKLQDSVPFSLYIYRFMEDGVIKKEKEFENTEIWEFHWDEQDPNMIAYKEKSKVQIYDGSSVLEQTNIKGLIYSFKNLEVTYVNLDKILLTPENPPQAAVAVLRIKAKQTVEHMLNSGKLDEALDYVQRNPHAELWNMIANHAVKKHRYDTAEYAFVKLQDYAGIQFVRKLQNMKLSQLQNAEILAFEEKLEDAKEIFVMNDRKDLAIEMYKKIDEPLEVYELVKHEDNDEEKAEAYRNLAENYYEDMDWEEALKYFEMCGDIAMQIDCLVQANEFGKLEVLVRNLDDESPHLEFIGDIFTSRGLCDQAIECYLKCKLPKKALATCIELNQWQKAQFIANSNHLGNVEGVLGKYAEDTVGASDEKSMSTLGLYMRAGRHLDAAKIAFDIAKDRKDKMMPFKDLKECYVLGGILVENHRYGIRELKRMDKHHLLNDALGDESGLTVEQIRILENTWRGAEAFHFMMLALKHFFDSRIEDALQTSVILADYEEFLDPADIHQMIALAAANCGQFKICSRAMMWLEAYEGFSESEREEMRNLSFELFSKCPPVNPPTSKMNCPACGKEINRYDLQCPECHFKFPICVATGRPIHENVSWVCNRCKHHVNKYETNKWTFCPLCHDTETFS
ncbi:hypothetical protein CAEBREN_14741 [Caenorhabditis brenneri]|uniref:Uncharacterized protein n=1 Tax=Caenorhabditis brenneri TaxID=135651 RepID=G0N4X9_CAEBE|nr:hypothetical protein CAEBREN_14741 [Caenorhabditis brenneri]